MLFLQINLAHCLQKASALPLDSVHNSHFTSTLPWACSMVETVVFNDKESCFEFIYTTLRESGFRATFRARKWLASSCLGQFEDALLAVVVEARECLWLCVVLLADATCDLPLQLLQTLFLHGIAFSHDEIVTQEV